MHPDACAAVRALAWVLVLLLAGCLQADPTAPAVPDASTPPPLVADHDHRADAHVASKGLTLVGHVLLKDLLGAEPGRVSDVQFSGTLAAVAVNGGSGGFVLLDASDPAKPTILSRYRSGSEDNWYVKFTSDGRHVLLTANGNLNAGPAAQGVLASAQRATVTGPVRGLHVIDVSDPRAPRLVAAMPAPVRAINAATWPDDAGELIFVSVLEERAPVTMPDSGVLANHVRILRLAETPLGVELQELARWAPPRDLGAEVFVHDLAVEKHPVTGRVILYAACWDAGAFLVDVTDPTQPAELGRFRPEVFPAAGLQTHTVKPHPGLVDGRHLTLVSPETFAGEPSGAYHLLDTTDPAAPRPLATWSLPGNLTNDQPLLWSPHEFTLGGGKAYTSNFHGGVWVLDLAGGQLSPTAMWADALPVGPAPRWAVDVETAVLHEGLVYAVDMGAGLAILRPEG